MRHYPEPEYDDDDAMSAVHAEEVLHLLNTWDVEPIPQALTYEQSRRYEQKRRARLHRVA